jgi:hypothetical protein
MYKYKLTAVIPTTQYGNIQPSIELEGDDIQALKQEAEIHIQSIWDKFGERPLVAKDVQVANGSYEAKRISTFTGETILYYDRGSDHYYTDLDGNRLLSGSHYAAALSPKFNKDMLLPKTAKAWGVDVEALGKIWDLNGDISTSYGTSVHNALEIYHLYHEIGDKIQGVKELDYNYVLPKNDTLRAIVLDFVDKFGVDALPEVMVSDIANKRAGQIDRLQIIDSSKKVCRIGDFKTNTELNDKKVLQYQHQLSFYAEILKKHGWKVEGLDIFHLQQNNTWDLISLDVLPVV